MANAVPTSPRIQKSRSAPWKRSVGPAGNGSRKIAAEPRRWATRIQVSQWRKAAPGRASWSFPPRAKGLRPKTRSPGKEGELFQRFGPRLQMELDVGAFKKKVNSLPLMPAELRKLVDPTNRENHASAVNASSLGPAQDPPLVPTSPHPLVPENPPWGSMAQGIRCAVFGGIHLWKPVGWFQYLAEKGIPISR